MLKCRSLWFVHIGVSALCLEALFLEWTADPHQEVEAVSLARACPGLSHIGVLSKGFLQPALHGYQ